jgi:hypothetical protein
LHCQTPSPKIASTQPQSCWHTEVAGTHLVASLA